MPVPADPNHTRSEITRLFEESAAGSDEARNRLTALVYAELHQMARARMSGERRDHTLGATALVSETYLRLFQGPATPIEHRDGAPGGKAGEDDRGGDGLPLGDRRAFFSAAATAMRRILIDHARAKQTQKRGGRRLRELPRLEADAVAASDSLDPTEFLSLDAAISRLDEIDERAAQVTRLRFFAGLDISAVAALLGVSDRTVKRDWEFARAWLRDALEGDGLP